MTKQIDSFGKSVFLNSETGKYEYFQRDEVFDQLKDAQGIISLSAYKEWKTIERVSEIFDPYKPESDEGK